MRRTIASLALAVTVATIATTVGCRAPSAPQSALAKRAVRPIVVALAVDQMSAWAAFERWPLLPEGGGFARLRREGAWVQELRYAHAATDTGPGHAALFTGTPPRTSGIVSNELPGTGGHTVSILADASTRLVSTSGVEQATGSSIVRLRVPTVADRFRAAVPDATIVSVSIKDRSAIFGGGRASTATLWFEPSLDRFVTSTAFARALPTWASPHAGPEAVAAARKEPWTLLDRAFVEAHAATPDDQAGEGDWYGLGTTFPHEVSKSSQPAKVFRATPWADAAVLALATAAVRARDASDPMLLAVSLSANDYVSHVFGPDSFEAWDELLRLDAALARFFGALDAAVGPDGWSAILAGDHGGPPLPEASGPKSGRPWCVDTDRFDRPCGPSERLFAHALEKELEEAATAAIGPGAWIRGVADPLVFFTDAARALEPQRRATLERALVERLRVHLGIAEVHVVREKHECPGEVDESTAALVCRSVVEDGTLGDLYVVPAKGSFFDAGYAVGAGENHGTPWLYDRTVPLLARDPGRIPAGKVLSGPLSYATYTRTLAAMLGLDPDPRWSGKDLTELPPP